MKDKIAFYYENLGLPKKAVKNAIKVLWKYFNNFVGYKKGEKARIFNYNKT